MCFSYSARDMVRSGGYQFSKRVLHYASSLCETRQFWFKQRSRLIAIIDTLGMPTLFFTQRAADGHWPEFARLICAENPDSSSSHSSAVSENLAIPDWLFYERISKFVKAFYMVFLGATDYSFRLEHRGSPHVPGCHMHQMQRGCCPLTTLLVVFYAVEQITSFVDNLVSTIIDAFQLVEIICTTPKDQTTCVQQVIC